MSIVDDYSPIRVGDTGAPFMPTFYYDDGVTLYPLSGVTISAKAVNTGGTVKTWNGTWTINTTTSIASYQYQASDVDTAGTWTVYIVLTSNGKPVHAQTKTLEILPAP